MVIQDFVIDAFGLLQSAIIIILETFLLYTKVIWPLVCANHLHDYPMGKELFKKALGEGGIKGEEKGLK